MGKKTRNPSKIGRSSTRKQYTEEQRIAAVKNIVTSMTDRGLTAGAEPKVADFLALLAGWQESGEAIPSFVVPICHGRAEIYGALPKYITDEPAVGVRPAKPP